MQGNTVRLGTGRLEVQYSKVPDLMAESGQALPGQWNLANATIACQALFKKRVQFPAVTSPEDQFKANSRGPPNPSCRWNTLAPEPKHNPP